MTGGELSPYSSDEGASLADVQGNTVSVERLINAPAAQIFALIADDGRHSSFDGSGTVDHSSERSAPLSLGSKFGMSMRLGIPYAITNTVVEFDENRLIAWRHIGGHRWRYELDPAGAGTRVRETYDWSTAILGTRLYIVATGWPKRAEQAMTRTLERLAAHVTGSEGA